MSFVNKVDKIEKMEQQMWKSTGETIREKKKRVKRDLSPKNYKWGVLGMFMYFLGNLVVALFNRSETLRDGLLEAGDFELYSPTSSDWDGNIFHSE